jgi:hypothetical protein
MSLAISIHFPDGAHLMAADSALSCSYDGQTVRVANFEDEEKIFLHNGAIFFCSGNYSKVKRLRGCIRSSDKINLEEIQIAAQAIFHHDTTDISTGIVVLFPDGSMYGMLSAHDFEIQRFDTECKGRFPGIHAVGYRMNEVLSAANDLPPCQNAIDYVQSIYELLQCEEVGGMITIYLRLSDGTIKKFTRRIPLSENIRVKEFFVNPRYNGIVNATDLQLSGTSISNIFSAAADSSGNLETLKIGCINIDGTTGAITFDSGASIIQTLYATSSGAVDWVSSWDSSWIDCEVWAKYSYDGGASWCSPVLIQGKNGTNGLNGSDGSDASVTRSNVYRAFLNNQTDGIYSYDGRMLVRSSCIGWGDDNDGGVLGTLASSSGKNSAGETTTLASVHSDLGMLLTAADGGLRLISEGGSDGVQGSGIFLTDYSNTKGEHIFVGKPGDWEKLSDLVGSSSVATFG